MFWCLCYGRRGERTAGNDEVAVFGSSGVAEGAACVCLKGSYCAVGVVYCEFEIYC